MEATVPQFIGICLVLFAYYKLVEKYTHESHNNHNDLNHKKDTPNHI